MVRPMARLEEEMRALGERLGRTICAIYDEYTYDTPAVTIRRTFTLASQTTKLHGARWRAIQAAYICSTSALCSNEQNLANLGWSNWL